jgi:hypothetical protein
MEHPMVMVELPVSSAAKNFILKGNLRLLEDFAFKLIILFIIISIIDIT